MYPNIHQLLVGVCDLLTTKLIAWNGIFMSFTFSIYLRFIFLIFLFCVFIFTFCFYPNVTSTIMLSKVCLQVFIFLYPFITLRLYLISTFLDITEANSDRALTWISIVSTKHTKQYQFILYISMSGHLRI